MAAKKKAAKGAAKAGGAAVAAKNSPYVQRVIEDDDLRQNVVDAFEAARSAYSRLNNGKAPATKQIFDDKKLQKDLQEAAGSFRDASVALREAPKQQSGGGIFSKLLLLLVAAGAALALSEGLRKKVLDALFGAEEEFEYTSATTPSTTSTVPTPTTPPAPTEAAGPATTVVTPTTPAAATPSVTPSPGTGSSSPGGAGSSGGSAG